MRLTILSRASDLARLQAMLVGRAIEAGLTGATISYHTRASAGDRNASAALTALPDKGAFTADLSQALASGAVDLVVHSWKDLPLEDRPDTLIGATIARADPRDLLLVRREVVVRQPPAIRVLSSSPRRAWLVGPALTDLVPWRTSSIDFVPVRGNIQTRLRRLVEGRGDALIVAKAALDRLLSFGAPFEAAAGEVREAIAATHWMVLPLRDVPGAPAQGALAVEIARSNRRLADALRPLSHPATWRAVSQERSILAAFGGGCHEALGATVLPRDYGRVVSVRAKTSRGQQADDWSLEDAGDPLPRTDPARIWPRPDERARQRRRLLDVVQPADDRGLWVARAEALPASWRVGADRLVWAAGTRTWRRLAARGIWVHGSAEGLGDGEAADVDALAGRQVEWHRLTHSGVDDPRGLVTYEVEEALPQDLAARTHFFWTSGTVFREALTRFPSIRTAWHSSGPGRTWRTIRQAIGADGHARVSLDYEAWLQEITV